jgi:hypothetical protein
VAHPCNLATKKAEIRRIEFKASLGKYFKKPYHGKNQQIRDSGMAQVSRVPVPEFKPQYCQNNNNDNNK